MIDKRLVSALCAIALLAACGGNPPAEDEGAASGEVLEGTISDEMLPIDRVRSEPPLEDPEAFAKARSPASAGAARTANGDGGDEGDEPATDDTASPAPDVTPIATED